ncbi:hypothetical protein BH20VER2_BH20VER2_05800 [soil metagenome]|nr:serine protease [Chthoniobacterales bacterium]
MLARLFLWLALASISDAVRAQVPEQSATAISQEVRDVFERSARAVVKIRASDKHGRLSGTGFFIDAAGTLYTAYSVAADADDFTVEVEGREVPAHLAVADRRSGIAILKADTASSALPVGKAKELKLASPVLTIGFPLDLPKTPSFGMVAGFDRYFLGRFFNTTHLRVNLPTQRGEAGAPLLNLKGEVVGILVSSIENGAACYALPIEAAQKIYSDFVRFGEVRHGWVGINVAQAPAAVEGSRAQFTEIMPDTPAAECGAQTGDILLSVGDTRVQEPEDVIDASFFITAGEKIPIRIRRGNEEMTLTVEAGFHPAAQKPAVLASPFLPGQMLPLSLEARP